MEQMLGKGSKLLAVENDLDCKMKHAFDEGRLKTFVCILLTLTRNNSYKVQANAKRTIYKL
jgi:hypothetical protein